MNLLRFGLFELDLAAHELRRSGHRVHLQDMPLRVLQMLLERPNDLVTRAAFFERLWPHDASGILDDNLNTAIRKLRLALNDSAHHPRFIETVPKRGYRFVGSVEHVQEPTTARQVDTPAADAAGARNGDIPHFNAAEMEVRNVPIFSLLPLRLFAARNSLLRSLLAACVVVVALVALFIWLPRSSSDHVEAMTADRDYTANPAAHRLYLEGRYLWNRRTGESLDAAAAAFEQVVTLDPTHADAHAALAQTHLLRSYYGSHPPTQVIPLARASAQRALELNDSIGAAHAVLATIAFQFDWDWDRAERGFQNALRLAPNDPTTHQWYGEMLQWRGRFDEAQRHYRKAFELDPQSLVIRTTLAGADLWSGDYRAAQAQLEDVLKLDPNFAYARSNLGLALLFQNRTPAAVIQLERAQSLFGERAVNASLAHALARLGDAASARAALVELARLTQTGEYVAPFRFAVIHMGLDETDEAIAWLARGIEAHDDHLVGLAVEPRFASLHGDPQFEEILRRLGLHDVRRAREDLTALAIHESDRGWAANGSAPILSF